MSHHDDQGVERASDRARETAAAGREQTRQVASSAGEQARNVTSTAQSEAREVARGAGDQARRLADDAREELRGQANAQVDRLARGLDDLSRQLRSMGESGEPGPVTDLAREAAQRTQQVAERLSTNGVDDVVRQLRDFGRNRPGLFLAGAFGAGLVAGRMARNMAQDPSGGNGTSGRRATGPGAYGATSDERQVS
jgi:vacuolar-type H+-ATPase subunit H